MSIPTSMSVSRSRRRGEFVGYLQIFGRSGRHKLRAGGSHCLVGKLLPLKITGWSFPSNHWPPHEIHAILTPAKIWPQMSDQVLFFIPFLVSNRPRVWSLVMVTPFADLVSGIRTKGLCALSLSCVHPFNFLKRFANYNKNGNIYKSITEFGIILECRC